MNTQLTTNRESLDVSQEVPSENESAKLDLNEPESTSGESVSSAHELHSESVAPELDAINVEKIPEIIPEISEPNPLERFKAKLIELKERFGLLKNQEPDGAVSQASTTSETQNSSLPDEKINVVEAMLAEVPTLSAEGKERIRNLFPDGRVCCPIKVARAIQLELLRENSKGLIKFSS